MCFLTIATAPKPFTNPHIAVIQWNAIQSWVRLGSEVTVLLVGDEPGMAEIAREAGVSHLAQVTRNAHGTPLVSSIFEQMRLYNQNPMLMYVNADILLMPELLKVIHNLASQTQTFLGVGQRWDLDIRARLDFSPGWDKSLLQDTQNRGRLHAPVGSDYFIFPRTLFQDMPDFAIGRAGWDNWMIFEARRRAWQVVDLTRAVTVIHQDHDYSHLPGGQPHYRLPESAENVRRGGGRRTIFNLPDTNYHLVDGKLHPKHLTWRKFWREVEIYPLIRLRSRLLGEFFFAVFHPIQAFREWRGWISYKFKHITQRS